VNGGNWGGAAATNDPRRDTWRTPDWLLQIVQDLGCSWDASGRGPDEWAHGFAAGNVGDALANPWPDDRGVFINPPFSVATLWVDRIVAHKGDVALLCKLTPSTGWWRRAAAAIEGATPHATAEPAIVGKGREAVRLVPFASGVFLGLFPYRVQYVPPEGIKASSCNFDSCLILRGGG
jgi:hypothetical protein